MISKIVLPPIQLKFEIISLQVIAGQMEKMRSISVFQDEGARVYMKNSIDR